MAPQQLIFVEGSFAELAQEMANYLQISEHVKPLLDQEKNEEALVKIVQASSSLMSAPEREFTGAYNLLIYLVINHAAEPRKYLPTLCQTLLKPIASSSSSSFHGTILANNAIAAIFNLLEDNNPLRYNVFLQIIRLTRQNNQFDLLKSNLHNLKRWLVGWGVDEKAQRNLYIELVDAAAEAGDHKESFHWLLRALATFDPTQDEAIRSKEAQKLSLRAVRTAIMSNDRYEFQDVRAVPSVQALADSHPIYAQLLDIFAEQDLEDFNEFCEEHQGFIEENLDLETLRTKMRLLTFVTLAANTPNREIPYSTIAKGLQIPEEDVERWTIDVIRAKLVEGRMSQLNKVFRVHRTTYRIFGPKQWRELGARVDQYQTVVTAILGQLNKQRSEMEVQRERDLHEMERRLANAGMGGGSHNMQGADHHGAQRRRGGGGGGHTQKQRLQDGE